MDNKTRVDFLTNHRASCRKELALCRERHEVALRSLYGSATAGTLLLTGIEGDILVYENLLIRVGDELEDLTGQNPYRQATREKIKTLEQWLASAEKEKDMGSALGSEQGTPHKFPHRYDERIEDLEQEMRNARAHLADL